MPMGSFTRQDLQQPKIILSVFLRLEMLPKMMKQCTCFKQERRTKYNLRAEQFWLWTVRYEHTLDGRQSLHVKQSKSVHPGGSVTLQWSLHSKKKEEKGDACPSGADVHCVRLGTGDSHPSIIYTLNQRSWEGDERSCFYTFSKRANAADKGKNLLLLILIYLLIIHLINTFSLQKSV